jgi:hypothetical protein
LTVLLALAGAFCVAVGAYSEDPCDRGDGVEGYFLLAGLLLVGAAAFSAARAMTQRAWVAWTSAVATPIVVGIAVSVISFLRWVGACPS